MKPKPASKTIRAAIYTRKSTEEGLEQEFNSLDAQRESGEAFVRSQQHEGWQLVPTLYDDGGFTGANMDRPALRRLMADIESGLVTMVVVYKVDRLSRSLLDFARMMEVFDRKGVAFVSVTQQFNTGTSMGRLMLNVLLSFAQFEREMISERTRDKMAAARRKGKYVGGRPVLGYDLDRETKKLVVNEAEAEQVRQIFELYLEHAAMLPVVQELARRGWVNKRWLTLKNDSLGGNAFTKTSLHKLLTNPIYVGQVKYKSGLHAGQQPAIVPAEVWQQTQYVLRQNCREKRHAPASKGESMLQGLLRCRNCGCAMTPAATSKKGASSKAARRYRYYVCTAAQKRGWNTCPSKSVPAAEIERFVVDQIRAVVHQPTFSAETLAAGSSRSEPVLAALTAFDLTWETLNARAQAQLLRTIVAEVAYDGAQRSVAVILKEGLQEETVSLGEEYAA
jgi:site-specific DNA recombinase